MNIISLLFVGGTQTKPAAMASCLLVLVALLLLSGSAYCQCPSLSVCSQCVSLPSSVRVSANIRDSSPWLPLNSPMPYTLAAYATVL